MLEIIERLCVWMSDKERLEEVLELMCESYYSYLTADNIKKSEAHYESYLDYKNIVRDLYKNKNM